MDNNNKTKKVKKSDVKNKKGNKVKFKDKHPKAALGIKIGLIVLVLVLIIGAGVLAGAFFGVFGEELKIDVSMLKVGDENSIVYDADGQQIAVLSGGTKRKSISLSDMSEYLPKAYVAIEDERFYKHSGIDIMRTARATFNYIIHLGKSSFGGSTITQQVVKNITQEKERTALAGVMRKVKEISKSIQVENVLSKDQILELYLNLIFVGGDDVNGVELGSVYYFDKSAKDLSIAECAYMAGINHSPNAYKPFSEFKNKENPEEEKEKMTAKIKKRTKTVLGKMKELSYITEDQYNEAVTEVDNGLNFKQGESASVTVDVSYVTDAAIDQILDQIQAENEDMDRKAAELYLYSSGLKIYTTQKTDIQNILEEEIVKDIYVTKYSEDVEDEETGKKEEQTFYSTPTMVIEDYRTGEVVAAATATGSEEERTAKTKLGYWNHPTQNKKQTGSSMKPIAVIAPGLESGTITGATVYYNLNTVWGATSAKPWRPGNSTGYSTYSNMRQAIEQSYNIPHAKALTNIGTEVAVEFCKNIGLPDFTTEGINLSLGGLHEGISPADMASAYSAIANDGVYKSQTFYTKVTDSQGNVLYEPEQIENRAMSEQNAYIEKDILTQPVKSGTATYCAIKGMDVAAKTGTTNDDYDRWLCGFTPYYSASCWYGYKDNHKVVYKKGLGGNPAGRIWSAVMKAVHENLENATFEEPEGIIRQSVCKISGRLPGPGCPDQYVELFTSDSVPTETCEGHSAFGVCNDTQLMATQFCPSVTPSAGYVPEKERDPKWITEGMATTMPTTTCTLHTAPAGPTPEEQAAAAQAAADAAAAQAAIDAAKRAEEEAKKQQQQQQPTTPTNPTTPTTPTTPTDPKPTDPKPTEPTQPTDPNPPPTPTEPTQPTDPNPPPTGDQGGTPTT